MGSSQQNLSFPPNSTPEIAVDEKNVFVLGKHFATPRFAVCHPSCLIWEYFEMQLKKSIVVYFAENQLLTPAVEVVDNYYGFEMAIALPNTAWLQTQAVQVHFGEPDGVVHGEMKKCCLGMQPESYGPYIQNYSWDMQAQVSQIEKYPEFLDSESPEKMTYGLETQIEEDAQSD
jgi:hypothetical protein